MQTMGPDRAVVGQEVGSELWPWGACRVPRAQWEACAAPNTSRAGRRAVREPACASGFCISDRGRVARGCFRPLGAQGEAAARSPVGRGAGPAAGRVLRWGLAALVVLGKPRGSAFLWREECWQDASAKRLRCAVGGQMWSPQGPWKGLPRARCPCLSGAGGPCHCGALRHPEGLCS